MKYQTLGKILFSTCCFKIEPLFLHIDRHIKGQFFPSWRPETRHWWLSVAKNGVKNSHFQPSLGHFLLEIQDGACRAKGEFPNEVLPFSQPMGHQSGAKRPSLGHIASSDPTLWTVQWQNRAIFTMFFSTFFAENSGRSLWCQASVSYRGHSFRTMIWTSKRANEPLRSHVSTRGAMVEPF